MKISHWYKWSITRDKTSVRIRRYRRVNGKIIWETYPKDKYEDFTEPELQALLRRLNATRELEEADAKARYDFDHAYINKFTLNGFETYLATRATSKEHINTLMSSLQEFTLEYFVRKLNLPDPKFWKKNESGFGQWLLKKKISAGYIKRIIQNTNRFIQFLHNTYPDEVFLFKLDPIGSSLLKQKEISEGSERQKYITESDFKKICDEAPLAILPMIKIAYYFGLRRAETLGLKPDDVYEDELSIERQLAKITDIPSYAPLKSKEKRSVPYWFLDVTQTYDLISQIKLIHPDTLSDEFKNLMKKLKLPFQFHDLRRTFITNALRKYHFMDVRLAAGHSDLETTQKYIQDDRQLKKKRFKPSRIKLVE